MLILLPPSEGKAQRRRGSVLNLANLSHPTLTEPRRQVLAAAAAVSATAEAAQILKVSPALASDIARNTELGTTPTLPAAQLYRGVLYEALDLGSLDPGSRRRASARIAISSAMFGVVRLTDRIPPYRLSMGVNLPGIGPLARFWREPLATALAGFPRRGLIIDTRSSTYAASWAPHPGSSQAQRWVQVRVPGATHMAKHTRGLVARALVQQLHDAQSRSELIPLLADRFDVELQPPTDLRSPWILSAVPRPRAIQ
ncbi:MAG: peroxide stress protein YaaA [Ornithinimicrobium sp.]